MRVRNRFLSCMLVLLLVCGLAGCEKVKEDGKRGKDLDYTVVPTADVPADFLKEIDTRKINAFQMSYEEGQYLYIAVGYGEQSSGGFNIRVIGLYEQGDGVCIETTLNGPGEDEVVSNKASYPYIVIKTEKVDKDIRFET